MKRKSEQELFNKIFEETGYYPSFSYFQDKESGYLGVAAFAGKYVGYSIISPKDMRSNWDVKVGPVDWDEESNIGAAEAVAGYTRFTDKDVRQCALGRLKLAVDYDRNGGKKREGLKKIGSLFVQGVRFDPRFSWPVEYMMGWIAEVIHQYNDLVAR